MRYFFESRSIGDDEDTSTMFSSDEDDVSNRFEFTPIEDKEEDVTNLVYYSPEQLVRIGSVEECLKRSLDTSIRDYLVMDPNDVGNNDPVCQALEQQRTKVRRNIKKAVKVLAVAAAAAGVAYGVYRGYKWWTTTKEEIHLEDIASRRCDVGDSECIKKIKQAHYDTCTAVQPGPEDGDQYYQKGEKYCARFIGGKNMDGTTTFDDVVTNTQIKVDEMLNPLKNIMALAVKNDDGKYTLLNVDEATMLLGAAPGNYINTESANRLLEAMGKDNDIQGLIEQTSGLDLIGPAEGKSNEVGNVVVSEISKFFKQYRQINEIDPRNVKMVSIDPVTGKLVVGDTLAQVGNTTLVIDQTKGNSQGWINSVMKWWTGESPTQIYSINKQINNHRDLEQREFAKMNAFIPG